MKKDRCLVPRARRARVAARACPSRASWSSSTPSTSSPRSSSSRSWSSSTPSWSRPTSRFARSTTTGSGWPSGCPGRPSRQYRALATSWRSLSAADTYHTLDRLDLGRQHGHRCPGRLPPRDAGAAGRTVPAAGRMPTDAWDRAKTRFGQVELLDASSARGLETIGQIRSRRRRHAPGDPRPRGPIRSRRADDLNTLIAVLNKINAAGVLSIRTNQNANQLLVSLLETAAGRCGQAPGCRSRRPSTRRRLPAGRASLRQPVQRRDDRRHRRDSACRSEASP